MRTETVETIVIDLKAGSIASRGAAEPLASSCEELVALSTLDAVVAALALDRVDFIKAEVEGWEIRPLHGGSDTLRRFRPRLLLELTSDHLILAGDRLDDAFAFLGKLGYAASKFAPGGNLVPVTIRRDGDFWFNLREEPLA